MLVHFLPFLSLLLLSVQVHAHQEVPCRMISTATLNGVTLSSFTCSNSKAVPSDNLLCQLLGIFCPPAPAPEPPKHPVKNVCSALCTNSCAHPTDLPPDANNCQGLADAIASFPPEIKPTFVVNAQYMVILKQGSCAFSFENTGRTALEYCWSNLGKVALKAGEKCFPPKHPYDTQGICRNDADGWSVNIART